LTAIKRTVKGCLPISQKASAGSPNNYRQGEYNDD
jgi:hypothetical protein